MSSSTADLLTVSGWSLIILPVLMVIVPYLRGRGDLATAWNFVLIGCAIFMGVACLDAVDPQKLVFERYVSFDFPDAEYKSMLVRSIFFLLCLMFFYYVLPIGKKFAANRFVHSPPWSLTLYGVLLIICGITAAIALSVQLVNIGFLREVFVNLGHKAAVFAVAFAFYAWYRNRTSPVGLLLFAIILAASVLYVTRVSHGRRLLLCVAFAPIAVMYWTNWRYRSPWRVLLLGGVAISLVVTVGLWYQCFRFFDRGKHGAERTFANTVQAAKQVTLTAIVEQLHTWKPRLAQGTYRYSLIVKRLVDSGELKVRPLNTLQFVFTYPIPRRYWEGKPAPLGAILVSDVLKLPQKTNWGLGVAGQAYYEGDWVALVIYAGLLVLLVRIVDEPLKREPNNPFFIAVCATSSLFLITWLRGDLGVHTVEVLECIVFLWLLQRLGALFAGSRAGAYFDFSRQPTAGRAAYPNPY